MPTFINLGPPYLTGGRSGGTEAPTSRDAILVAEDPAAVMEQMSASDGYAKFSMLREADNRPMGDVWVNKAAVRFVHELS